MLFLLSRDRELDNVELIQPTPTATGVSLADYQKILDSIPPIIKLQHKYYKWFHGLGAQGDSITFSKDQPPFSDAEARRIAWSKEPYSLDGPDQGRGSNWNSFGDLIAGLGGGGLGFSGSILRRSQQNPDD
ncbi:hypothetical protein ABW21_db0209855 [Orbilia brochopaga]|nr:hypothetical protein ABW21_db0209855 [Drechslerella brochopaga]